MSNFQWVFDNATSLSWDNNPVRGITESRLGDIRITNRGTPYKDLIVQLPDGYYWNDIKTNINNLETNLFAEETITIKYSVYPWYYNYLVPSVEESYTVVIKDFPQWTIFDYHNVSWSGPFIFKEVP